MRYLMLFSILLCLFGVVEAQYNGEPRRSPARDALNASTIDSAYIRILYALNAEDINNTKTYDDLQRLEIGSRVSKYYSYFLFNSDSLVTEYKKKNRGASAYPMKMGEEGKMKYWSEYISSEYFKDISENTFTEYSRLPMYMKQRVYSYTDKNNVQEWQIHNDTTSILGYLCQKATCNFRGRNFIAWFTMDIPINNGPWKFGGLPGLILKVYDEDNLYCFESVFIEIPSVKIPIIKYKGYDNSITIERSKLLKLQKDLQENYATITGLVSDRPLEKIIYTPLELE